MARRRNFVAKDIAEKLLTLPGLFVVSASAFAEKPKGQFTLHASRCVEIHRDAARRAMCFSFSSHW